MSEREPGARSASRRCRRWRCGARGVWSAGRHGYARVASITLSGVAVARCAPAEAGVAEQHAVLGGGALVAAGQHQHVQVGEKRALGVGARVDALRNDPFHEQEPRAGAMRGDSSAEWRGCARRPVVNDPLEQ